MPQQPVDRVVNLLDPAANVLLNVSPADAQARVAAGDVDGIRRIDGQFALVAKSGEVVRMARSIGRPLRFFLAKQVDGPCLVVAERIDEIATWLKQAGLYGQFHPSYTRMAPAHHLLELRLIGCPDPNPRLTRFFTPPRNRWSTDLEDIGRRYIEAVAATLDGWLDRVPENAPLGVLFSGGVDSGAVLLTLYHRLLARGQAPQRLKAFTLTVDGQGADARQAREFLDTVGLGYLLEEIDVPRSAIDPFAAVRVVEDYKPLDIESATMALALCRGIRERYPDWVYLVDGDGGDENFKDYPIHENPELTIRSVLNNPLLYHEGWGVEAVKHSLTYSGGQSRGHVRSYAPARSLGFVGFSPLALPNVIEVTEGIPFIELTNWDEQKLYALKGEIVGRGVRAVTGLPMPVYEKRRFQRGAVADDAFATVFRGGERAYRRYFEDLYEDAVR
jgi:asparagine synthase (glutamine-hydrolysing)